jgi:glutathione S-transferase
VNIKLYYAEKTRSMRPRWVLEELGVPYSMVPVTLSAKDPEYRKIHPLGAVPAIEIDGQVMFESAAICMYLADLFPEKKLGPAAGERGAYYQWVLFGATTLEQRNLDVLKSGRDNAWFVEAAAVVEAALGDRPYLFDRFTVADVMVGSTLAYAVKRLEGHPALQAYCARIAERPAYQTSRKL